MPASAAVGGPASTWIDRDCFTGVISGSLIVGSQTESPRTKDTPHMTDNMTAAAATSGRAARQALPSAGTRRTAVLAIILASYLMIVLDISIVITALPKIHSGLGFSAAGLSWVQNAYTLAFGGLLLLGARAGDILGRRRMFVAGIALFTAASLAVGVAQSAAWLLAARAVQGAGAASGLVNVAHQLGGSLGLGILVSVAAAAHPAALDARHLLADRTATSLTAGTAMLALALVVVVTLMTPKRPRTRY
jgi:MFS family permease